MATPVLDSINVTLWEKELMTGLYEECFVKNVTRKPTDVRGNKVIFSTVDKGQWADYQKDGDITWSKVGATSLELTFEKQRYFAKKLDDIDSKRINDHNLINSVVEEHKGVFAEEVNKYYLDTVKASIPANQLLTGASAAVIKLTKADVYDKISTLVELADKNKVPQQDRYLFISPSILRLLRTSNEIVKDYEVMANGFLNNIRICGCNVIVSTCLPLEHEIILTQKNAVGYGDQIDGNNIEFIEKLQSTFASGVRALGVYGAKVLRVDSIFGMKCTA